MYKTKIIKQIAAFGLLLLFILSNTPKQFMHDLFANHVDGKTVKTDFTDTFNIKNLSFHCQADHQVVESPFTDGIYSIVIYSSFVYPQLIASSYNFIKADHAFHFDLRGPPMS